MGIEPNVCIIKCNIMQRMAEQIKYARRDTLNGMLFVRDKTIASIFSACYKDRKSAALVDSRSNYASNIFQRLFMHTDWAETMPPTHERIVGEPRKPCVGVTTSISGHRHPSKMEKCMANVPILSGT